MGLTSSPIALSAILLSIGYVAAQDSSPSGPTMPGIAWNCNAWHTVVSGVDYCYSIQQEYGITAAEFLEWNPAVSSDCLSNFWPDYSYCVGVDPNAVSTSTPTATSTTPTQTSSNSNSITPTTSPTTSSPVITTATPYSTRHPISSYNLTTTSVDTTFPPTHTLQGQPSYCNTWHLVGPGDSCVKLVNLYGSWITSDQLLEYNPTIGVDCNGLYIGWYVCVGIQPQTAVSLEWSTSPTEAVIPVPTLYTPPVYEEVPDFTATPLQTGIPSSCQNFYEAQAGDTCTNVINEYGYITQDQFLSWNPALANNCDGLLPGYYYCVANFDLSNLPPPPTVTATPSPTAIGTINECNSWYLAVTGDNCTVIAEAFRTFSESDFISWNPDVWSTCSNFEQGIYYCVGISGLPTTSTALPSTTTTVSGTTTTTPPPTTTTTPPTTVTTPPTSTTTPPTTVTTPPTSTTTQPTTTTTATTTVIDGTSYPLPPAPTASGTTPQCKTWHVISSGNTCSTIAANFAISKTQLNIWNNYINIACSNIWIGYAICVSSPIEASYWTSLGCYTDSTSRALANQLSLPNQATTMTPKLCQDACKAAGYKYAGVEFTQQCFCDNSIKNGHSPATSGCTNACPGATSLTCGGANRLNVYRNDKYDDLGCHTDSQSARTLQNRIIVENQNTILTREICQHTCERGGYILSGVEYAVQCWCDNAIHGGTIATSGCNQACPGNTSQICGGPDRVNIMKRPQSRSLGCYSDNTSKRTLQYQLILPNAKTLMTPDFCRSACRSTGFLYSGVQYSSQCFCGDEIQSTGLPSTGCNMACAGNPSEICGGSSRINIYLL